MTLLSAEAMERVASATVSLPQLGGRGVLVPGGFVVTAAHCIRWNGEGAMTLGDYFLEPVETTSGARFNLTPHFADPVSDLALLGPLDNQEFGEDCAAFDVWCGRVPPVRLGAVELAVEESMSVHVLRHDRGWVTATVTRFGTPGLPTAGRLFVKVDGPIKGGSSGGPIVDAAGQLIGIVSQAKDVDPDAPCDGMMPILSLAMPRWAWSLIDAAPETQAG